MQPFFNNHNLGNEEIPLETWARQNPFLVFVYINRNRHFSRRYIQIVKDWYQQIRYHQENDEYYLMIFDQLSDAFNFFQNYDAIPDTRRNYKKLFLFLKCCLYLYFKNSFRYQHLLYLSNTRLERPVDYHPYR